ncbi:hypothetical protein CB1_001774003 [Camelus ferus]|nr:hypothetical protein CB1_001774003 [Camelus ferus]
MEDRVAQTATKASLKCRITFSRIQLPVQDSIAEGLEVDQYTLGILIYILNSDYEILISLTCSGKPVPVKPEVHVKEPVLQCCCTGFTLPTLEAHQGPSCTIQTLSLGPGSPWAMNWGLIELTNPNERLSYLGPPDLPTNSNDDLPTLRELIPLTST